MHVDEGKVTGSGIKSMLLKVVLDVADSVSPVGKDGMNKSITEKFGQDFRVVLIEPGRNMGPRELLDFQEHHQ